MRVTVTAVALAVVLCWSALARSPPPSRTPPATANHSIPDQPDIEAATNTSTATEHQTLKNILNDIVNAAKDLENRTRTSGDRRAPNGSAFPERDEQAPVNGTRPFASDSRRPNANGTEHGPFGALDAGRSSEPPRHDANGTEPRPGGERRAPNGSAPFPDQRRDEQAPANGTAALAYSLNNSRNSEVHPAHRKSTGLSADRDAGGKVADDLDEQGARVVDGVRRSEPPTLASVLPAVLAAVVLTCLVVAAASSLRRWWWAGRMLSYDAVKAVDTSAV